MKLEFHHINFVSKNIDNMNNFYKNILSMNSIPIENFPRTEETSNRGYSGKINFVTAVSYTHLTLPTTPYV